MKQPLLDPAQWRVSNFRTLEGRFVGGNASIEVQLREQGDAVDTTTSVLVRDLAFASLRDDGVVILRSVPLLERSAAKDPMVLLERYVASTYGQVLQQSASTGYYNSFFGQTSSHSVAVWQAETIAVVARESTTIAGLPAARVTIDATQLMRRIADPTSVDRRVSIWLVLLPKPVGDDLRHALVVVAENAPDRFQPTFDAAAQLITRIEPIPAK